MRCAAGRALRSLLSLVLQLMARTPQLLLL